MTKSSKSKKPTKTLRPGTYRLTQDVPNPKPNRRRRDWTGAETFKKGWVFSLDDRDGRANAEDPAEFRKHGTRDMIFQGSNTFKAIEPYLEAVDEEPSDLLERCGWSLMGGKILDELKRTHVLTTAQVEKAARMSLAIARIAYLCEPFQAHILGRGMDGDRDAYRVVFGRSLDASKVVLWVNVHPDAGTYRVVQQRTTAATDEPDIHAASVEFVAALTAKGYRKVP